jgi:prepilin-type N-terminal cleavage/methylation domain-containing protein
MKTKLSRGLTLVELMIVVAIVAVLLTLAAPSLYDFIVVQRLKAINAQLVTDLQFARSTASSGNLDVQLVFAPAVSGSTMSCYTLYTDTSSNPRNKCDCKQAPGARCPQSTSQEIRTVQVPASSGVRLGLPSQQARGLAFLANTGAIRIWPVDYVAPSPEFMVEASIDSQRKLQTWVGLSGRPSVCAPGGVVTGNPPC